MIFGVIAALILFIAVVIAISAPLLASNAPMDRSADNTNLSGSNSSDTDLNDELELDYKTGKVSESDYLALKR